MSCLSINPFVLDSCSHNSLHTRTHTYSLSLSLEHKIKLTEREVDSSHVYSLTPASERKKRADNYRSQKEKTKQFFSKNVQPMLWIYIRTCTHDSNSKMHASIVITSNTLHNTIGDHFLVDVVLPFVRRAPGGPPPPAAFDSKDRSVLSVQSPNKVSHQLVPDKLDRKKKHWNQ